MRYANVKHFKTTKEIKIPEDPLMQVIGQDKAVKIARIAAKQKRNLLLIGPPGVGKSLIAQAMAFHIEKPKEEVSVLHNPSNPERPFVEIRTREQIEKEKKIKEKLSGKIVEPSEVPAFVAEKLGFRCRFCGALSSSQEEFCPKCGREKFTTGPRTAGDLLLPYLEEHKRKDKVYTTKVGPDGKEEVIVYKRRGEKIVVMDQTLLEKIERAKNRAPRKIILPLNRNNFVIATGASETELLGDVRHDPYGGNAQIGVLPYKRVVPGAIHEAHEGILFIDELSSLEYIQRYLLTAMQEKKYPIIGRNPQSAGASVRVEGVPCDFTLVAAANVNDLKYILPPLRSRMVGNGYEIVLETYMPDTEENRMKIAQFAAQEVLKDGKIPHLNYEAVQALCDEAKRRAREIDGAPNALTLRLRDLSGIIRLAGDQATEKRVIEKEDIKKAVKDAKNAEEQLSNKYGSMWRAGMSDSGNAKRPEQRDIR